MPKNLLEILLISKVGEIDIMVVDKDFLCSLLDEDEIFDLMKIFIQYIYIYSILTNIFCKDIFFKIKSFCLLVIFFSQFYLFIYLFVFNYVIFVNEFFFCLRSINMRQLFINTRFCELKKKEKVQFLQSHIYIKYWQHL